MKHIKFWSIGIPCILLASVMLYVASCSSDDEPPAPPVPMEVVDEGADTNVTSKPLPGNSGTSSAGTEFSYKSWITLQKDASGGASYAPARGPKNAPSNDDVETITVMLHAVFHNLDTTIVVNSFDIGEPTFTFTYGTNGRRTEGYVTVTDSVTYYNVNFDGFGFRYMLENEVAVYNDHYISVVMPYHKIKNYRDNGFSVEDLSFVLEPNSSGGKDVYQRKKIKHSITVEYNGADYTLHGNVILKKRVGTHPCIVSSELVDKGISDIENSNMYTTYTSWAKVRYLYSDNNSEIKTYSIRAKGALEDDDVRIADEYPSADVSLVSTAIDSVSSSRVEQWEYYSVFKVTKYLTIKYNLFSTVATLKETCAHYDDGILQFDFPNITYSEVNVDYSVREYGQSQSWINYLFFEEVKVKFGDAWHSFSYSYLFSVYKH